MSTIIEKYILKGKIDVLDNLFKIILKIFYFIYFSRDGKGWRKRGKHQCVVASRMPPTGDLDCNPGMCPDWVLN